MRVAGLWVLVAACSGEDGPGPGKDADTDTDTDADTDTDTDADTDTDTDTDPCPGAGAFVGDPGWAAAIEVTNEGSWCATFDESRTLEQELAIKARLSLPLGTYPLPDAAGTEPYRLPICFETAGADVLAMGDAGEVTTTVSSYGGYEYRSWSSAQPVVDAGGAVVGSFAIAAYASDDPGLLPTFVLDGRNEDAYQQEPLGMTSCTTGPYACAGVNARSFVPCAPVRYDEQHHLVGFDGGDVDLRLDIGGSYASTEPASFVRATGTLDGVAFDVTDYFRLVYNPEHHHFQRHFAVLFDAPIGGACGLAVRELGSSPDVARVERVDCALGPLDERAISSNVYVP
jgi:hypothetical protein